MDHTPPGEASITLFIIKLSRLRRREWVICCIELRATVGFNETYDAVVRGLPWMTMSATYSATHDVVGYCMIHGTIQPTRAPD